MKCLRYTISDSFYSSAKAQPQLNELIKINKVGNRNNYSLNSM